MKLLLNTFLFFSTIISIAQVSFKEAENINFENITFDDGSTTHAFSLNGKLIGPSHSQKADGMLTYTYYNEEGKAEGFQMAVNPSSGIQVLQTMKDNLKHGNAFKMIGNELAWADLYKKDELKKAKDVLYKMKESNKAKCLGNCINGFGLRAGNEEQMLMGFFWGEVAEGPMIHTFKSGDMYRGAMKGWEREGFGVYKWASGGYYIGYWKKSKRHGLGIWYNNDGTIKQKGYYKKDKLVKEL